MDTQLFNDFMKLKQKSYNFLTLVKKMRSKQKEYFRTRDPKILQEAKKLERLVDKEIEDYLTPKIL